MQLTNQEKEELEGVAKLRNFGIQSMDARSVRPCHWKFCNILPIISVRIFEFCNNVLFKYKHRPVAQRRHRDRDGIALLHKRKLYRHTRVTVRRSNPHA